MRRSYLLTIGWLLAVVLLLHAAMLAGGSHQTEAHEPSSQDVRHAAMHAQASAPSDDATRLLAPEMSECALLSVAALRFEVIVTTPAVRQAIEASIRNREPGRSIEHLSRPRDRAELQVFLI